jgi:hypothetical protein
MSVLKITFDTDYTLICHLRDNNFVSRWQTLLANTIQNNKILQEDSLSAFFTEDKSRQYLESAIDKINAFTKREFIRKPNNYDYESMDYYNYLHERFEFLTGSDYDNPTGLASHGPISIRTAIRHLNRFCHRLENRPYQIGNYLRIEWDSIERKLLELEDFNLFEDIEDKEYIVYLDYSTLGKSLVECFMDGLTPSYKAMKLQEHYSSNFIIKFVKKEKLFDKDQFLNWLKFHGIKDLPKAALGAIVLGDIKDMDSFEKVKQSNNIIDIRLERD